MQHLKHFILARPFHGRVNAQSLAAGDEGERYDRILVTRGERWIAAYTYTGRDFTLRLDRDTRPWPGGLLVQPPERRNPGRRHRARRGSGHISSAR